MLGNSPCFCHMLIFFKINFFSIFFSGMRSECQPVLNPIKHDYFAGSDRGAKCLQMSSADDTIKQIVKKRGNHQKLDLNSATTKT